MDSSATQRDPLVSADFPPPSRQIRRKPVSSTPHSSSTPSSSSLISVKPVAALPHPSPHPPDHNHKGTSYQRLFGMDKNGSNGGSNGSDGSDGQSSQEKTPLSWSGRSRWGFVTEMANIIFALILVVFGCVLLWIRGQEETPTARMVVQISQIVPTLWPIIFAVIVGNGVREVAHWKLEKGERLLTLEQLMGSQTLGGTVKTALTQAITILSLALFIIWSFSVLGSQAVLRAIYLQENSARGTGDLRYARKSHIDDGGFSYNALQLTSFRIRDLESIARVMQSSLIFSRSAGLQYAHNNTALQERLDDLGGFEEAGAAIATDDYGNIRLPNIRTLPGYKEGAFGEWVDVPWNSSIIGYSSLVGVPIGGLPRHFAGNVSGMVSDGYHTLTCDPWTVGYDTFLESNPSLNWYHNTNSTAMQLKPYALQGGFFIDTIGKFPYIDTQYGRNNACSINSTSSDCISNPADLPPRTIFFGSAGTDNEYATKCLVDVVYVDAEFSCQIFNTTHPRICAVNRVREVYRPPELKFNLFELSATAGSTASMWPTFLDDYPIQDAKSSLVELYLADPLNSFAIPGGRPEVGIVPIEISQERLTLLLNTWFDTWYSMQDEIFAGDVKPEDTAGSIVNTTSEMVFPIPSTYGIHTAWLVVYFISSFMLLIIACTTVIIRSMCRAPEILGYVGSMVRDSEHFKDDLTGTASLMSGRGVSKALPRLRVRLGDVNGRGNIGKIALAPEPLTDTIDRSKKYI